MKDWISLLIIFFNVLSTSAFSLLHRPQTFQQKMNNMSLHANTEQSRLAFFHTTSAALTFFTIYPRPVSALVKGNTPPTSKKAPSDERKCRNVEECQEMAEKAAAQAEMEERANMLPVNVTPQGTKYRDVGEAKNGSQSAKEGDRATIFYKVLKLGKRSFDGLSGEGTVVFSRGE
jgi:FKBP-type peptidyl-prolyl cis-trans isomerase